MTVFFQLAAYKCKFLYREEFCLTEPLVPLVLIVVLYTAQSPNCLRLFVLSREMGQMSEREKEVGKLCLWVQVD